MGKTKVVAEPGKQEIIITREFDAPREILFKAMTDPKLIAQWWGPAKFEMIVDTMEPHSGGSWRFLHRADGQEFGFHGVYHEITAPARIVDTFEFEGMPGHVSMETMTLEEKNGKTLLTTVIVFQSMADRDGMIASGMESGMSEGFDRLEALVKQ